MTPLEFKTYFNHVLGINLLNGFLGGENLSIRKQDKEIRIPEHLSSSLCLTVSYIEKGCLLICDRNVMQFIKLIAWQRCVIRGRYIYLVSKKVRGDKVKLPDQQMFVIRFTVDFIEKLNLLRKSKHLNIAEYQIDNEVISVASRKVVKIPLFFVDENTSVLTEQEKRDRYNNILTCNENYANGLVTEMSKTY